MKCQKCGNELKPTDKFCDSCGNPVEHHLPIKSKKGLKAWHIVLIMLGGIFALIGLFFCFILWLGFTFGTTEGESTVSTTQSIIETTESSLAEYTLDSENLLGDISYLTPSEFRTSGKDGESLLHFTFDDDKILAVYSDLDIEISSLDDYDKREMIDTVINSFADSEEDGFVEEKSILTKIKGCYGINYKYHSDSMYVHFYAFLYEQGLYMISYSSSEPITEEDEQIFEEIMSSIELKN